MTNAKDFYQHGANILLALARGEEVEKQFMNAGWQPFTGAFVYGPGHEAWSYRIKPQPREVWIPADHLPPGDGLNCTGRFYWPESNACVASRLTGRMVKFREVIE